MTNRSKKKKLDSINILIDEKKQKDLVMYYTRYGDNKSILRLHCHKFKGKIQKHEETNISDFHYYMLDIILDKNKHWEP